MKNANKIMLAGAVALGLTAIANTEASADTYTVRPGDTVWGLAQANGVTIDEIDALNPAINQDTHLIIVGDTITLPDGITVTLPEVATNTQPVTEQAVQPEVQSEAPVVTQPVPYAQPVVDSTPTVTTTATNTGSVYDQFIAAGGTQAMWDNIVMPESGGDVNAANGQYHGLGQTNQSWGYGSVAEQTQGMLQYAQERYGSIENSISFRNAVGYW